MKQHFLNRLMLLPLLLLLTFFANCNKEEDTKVHHFSPSADVQSKLQETLITMNDGDIIHLSAGTYNFTATLSVDDKKNYTIMGDGMNNTILSFAGQVSGSEGLKISNGSNVLLHNFTVEDTKGDGIKVKDTEGLTFMNVGAQWSGEADESNGAYGLYPVTCKHILIDGCYVKGASDAGIYVGQSEYIIVKNSTVEYNVAGIEIENCNYADVFNNLAKNNTGGILVFDMPGLTLKNGRQCRVYNNQVQDNNYRNFAPAGNVVGNVPPGTGIMIMTSKEVEVFNNTITNNNVLGLGIVSYEVLAYFDSNLSYDDPAYVPYVEGIYIHDNTFSRTPVYPQNLNNIGTILTIQYPNGDIPDIIYDGIENPNATGADSERICIMNNTGATFVDIDAENFFAGKSTDITPFLCTHNPLPAVSVNAPLP
ncbi:MAG TPA: parallel beta-helix domain-containing protein [Chitinophagales bacterium]|nr:parallel beta-helix domain-containing protein [Chitinophagales bacterium]HRK26471.1 parallel beta-helix domain-containing protein [Chitinophagales bacterium]